MSFFALNFAELIQIGLLAGILGMSLRFGFLLSHFVKEARDEFIRLSAEVDDMKVAIARLIDYTQRLAVLEKLVDDLRHGLGWIGVELVKRDH